MKLVVLGSSSSGNCYLLEDENESMIIECGIKLSEVKMALNYDISKVKLAICTHRHLDHFKYIKDFASAGIDIYASNGTLKGLTGHRYKPMNEMETISVSGFKVKGFKTVHDCIEPFGFLIWNNNMGNTLFITDSFYTQYKFPNLNNIILEANYCEDELNKRLYNGKIEGFLYKRITESHMSIQTAERLLLANDLSSVHNIILIHLSNANSDERKFKERIENATGKTVTIADKGQIINLNKEPF